MYDAILLVSFGGPECINDVMPFLENVLRGKNVPRERMLEVAEHYYHFGGVSPINQQCRDLISALKKELDQHGPHLPIYWGNRNWAPMLDDVVGQMTNDGIQRALAFFTSTFSSYSGCRQYRENIQAARAKVGPSAPVIDRIRLPFNHPGFIEPQREFLRDSLNQFPEANRQAIPVLFCAHSIPGIMAENCAYEAQLRESSRLVAEGVGHERWELVFQSRSGPPNQPWLEPDVCDRIEQLYEESKITELVIQPIGFVSDHMEVLFDLDEEADALCQKLSIKMVRARTVGTHPRYVQMIRELITERMEGSTQRPALGCFPALHDVCPENCCLYPRPETARRPS
jgi:protoporphyrin/coproporphyrin ferrochelatase